MSVGFRRTSGQLDSHYNSERRIFAVAIISRLSAKALCVLTYVCKGIIKKMAMLRS